jgi:multiple sugar transport system substrate-binding protein
MKSLMGAVFAISVAAAGQASAQEVLNVSWVKGFYKSEDDALYETIKKFEQKTGVKVELSQYPVQDMIPKTVASLDSGTPPDVAYADVYDFQVTGKWAFEGRLEDVSDIIEPIKDRFAPNTVETTYLLNEKTGKRAYYAYPIKQQTMHIEYWIDMLNQAGFQEADIPKTWKEYWAFWCGKVQPAYRKASGQRGYGIGQPLGVDSSDSFYSFLTFADAYNVKMVDNDGKLLIDDPKVKEGLTGALTDYTEPYAKGCVPPSATSWKDPDKTSGSTTRRPS